MFWVIVLLLLAGAGFYFYQKMMEIEKEIRAEQEAEKAGGVSQQAEVAKEESPAVAAAEEEYSDPPVVTPDVEKMAAKAEPVSDEFLSLEDEILAAVNNLPGVKQTELYTSFADINRKQLQQLLKEMDDGGKLKREKKGSSYLLYPV